MCARASAVCRGTWRVDGTPRAPIIVCNASDTLLAQQRVQWPAGCRRVAARTERNPAGGFGS
jgi:hypothetical protein